MLKLFFFSFFANLGNYRSGHGAQNRDRDPGRCTVTARVAEAALRFVQPKPNLPTNSSLTSLQQHIFGGYNACQLVYCVASGTPDIPMECAGMSNVGMCESHNDHCAPLIVFHVKYLSQPSICSCLRSA